MKYVEAINEDYEGGLSLFLAGGITNCPDWQADYVEMLKDVNITLYNPRRKFFPMGDKNAGKIQIDWEFRYLRRATAISFWFPKETICPIVLYELGAWSVRNKPIFVGVHKQYQRRFDVETQTRLVNPGVRIVYTLEELANQVKEHFKEAPKVTLQEFI